MSAALQPARRGRKHRCAACGAAFYDLERELNACPKCETPYGAEQMPRGEPARKRKSWARSARPAEPEAAPEAPAAEATEEDGEGAPILDPDDAEDADEAETGDEGNEAAEDDGA